MNLIMNWPHAEPSVRSYQTASAEGSWYAREGKRIFDCAAALTGLLLLAVPLLLLWLLVWIVEGPPVLFRQWRVGRAGTLFSIYKFRTMRNGAEHASSISVAGDPRITPLGHWLRRFKLDELPQLWNVLRGDMSLVGPRPDVPGYMDRLEGEASSLLRLRPGITGPATLAFRHEEELLAHATNPQAFNDDFIFSEKVRLNLEYLKSVSFKNDLRYIFETILPSGSSGNPEERRLAALLEAADPGSPSRTIVATPAPLPKVNGAIRKRIFLSPPHMGGAELQFVQEAFASNYIAPLGPMVDAFEQEFADLVDIPHCLALSSGTAAMHLALRELGVGPGDEVLASTLTFIGSVSSAAHLGARLAFIDSDLATWTMAPDLLAEELAACARRGRMPKAVIPTDLYGQCADLDQIKALCEPYGIPVVVDAAEAIGATYKGRPAGAGARAAVYSFNGNKIITTSGGGLLASADKSLIDHARKLSQQAREPLPHYEHNEIGYNYRMSNILAAIGRGQLRVLPERVAAKRRIFETYRQLLGDLPGLQFMPEAPGRRGNCWLTVVLIDPAEFGADSTQVRLALEAEEIESRPVWKPMHLQPVFRGCRLRGGSTSEYLFRNGLCLPSGTALTVSELARVAQLIRGCHVAKCNSRTPWVSQARSMIS